jgi:ketosteroid isomerase-like protein
MAEEAATRDVVELWRRYIRAINERDIDRAIALYAPDVVWESLGLGTTVEGAPAVRSHIEGWMAAFEQWQIEAQETVDLGAGVVFTVSRFDARPAGSAGRVLERWAFTSVWVAGEIVRLIASTDIEESRAAAERLAQERADG